MQPLNERLRFYTAYETPRWGFNWQCPSCETIHSIPIQSRDGSVAWEWDGNEEAPSTLPSILVNPGQSNPGRPTCHCYIEAGKIRFCEDHPNPEFAGRIVEIPDWPVRVTPPE